MVIRVFFKLGFNDFILLILLSTLKEKSQNHRTIKAGKDLQEHQNSRIPAIPAESWRTKGQYKPSTLRRKTEL